MTTSRTTDHANIYAALAAFQAETPVIAKNKTAQIPTKSGGSYSYKYADLADVVTQVSPILAKHGLAFLTVPVSNNGSYELAGILTHSSGETIKSEGLPLYGRTNQELGSAITYARRYLFGAMTGVVTDIDDDGSLAQQNAQRAAAAKNWDGVLQRAARITDKDTLLSLYHAESVGTAPEEVQNAFLDFAQSINRAHAEEIAARAATDHTQEQA